MGRPLRYIRPGKLVEITCRTMQSRLLLRPSPELKKRVLGVLGRAQRQTGIEIHAFVFVSNHYHLLISPQSPVQLVRFMNQIQSNLAREAGDLHDWTERFWSCRFRDIPVSDEPEAQIARLRYCLAHGVKEGLVSRCRDWPGASCVRALADGEPLEGVWYDRSAYYEARRRKGRARLQDFASTETVMLSPLPCWRHLEPEEIRRRVGELIEQIEKDAHRHRLATGEGVAGVRAVRKRHPHDRPQDTKRGPAPRFHTATREAWCALREAVQTFAEEFRHAADLLRQGHPRPDFPPGAFPPHLPPVPALAPG
jgi:REP element-mobilizing transposase RayT